MADAAMWSYIDRALDTVPGWFERVDALLFAGVDRWYWRPTARRVAGLRRPLLEEPVYEEDADW